MYGCILYVGRFITVNALFALNNNCVHTIFGTGIYFVILQPDVSIRNQIHRTVTLDQKDLCV